MKPIYSNRCGERNSRWKGGKLQRVCEVCGASFPAHKCHVKRGGGRFCGNKCSGIFRSLALKGNSNPAWKGGVTPEIIKQRVSTKYEVWRDLVYKRDNFTCRKCGDSRGGNLNAHHVKGFTAFPELRFTIDNGITLCTTCHKLEHKRKL